MNRWLVAGLIALALIVIVSPGIVGRLAEKSVEENLNFAASESEEIVVTTESFERGWFTSEGRHRIELGDGEIRSILEETANETHGMPSLIIDTHIDHGLLPITSMSRDSGSLKPGLASTVSTMKLDPGNGELIELPGNIYSDVALTGETTSRFLLEAGSRDLDDVAMEWLGADIVFQTNPGKGSVSIEGVAQPFSVEHEDIAVAFDGFAIDGEQLSSSYAFKVGSVQLDIGRVDLSGTDGTAGSIGKVSMLTANEIEGDRVNSKMKLEVLDVKAPIVGDSELVLDVFLNGLDAQAFDNIIQMIRDSTASLDEDGALASLYPKMEADLQKILTAGAELRVDRFELTLPDGKISSKLRFDISPSKTGADFSWPAVLLALDASADIHLPVALFDAVAESNPDIEMVIAMGIFRKNGDFYEMKAEYSQGLVTVNGAPMPIPLQGL